MAVAERREREQQLRRESIIKASRELFSQQGFEITTVDEIADLAELGKGTIYSYFKSKDEIYVAILEADFAILQDRMQQAYQDSASAIEALERLYETFIQYNLERRGFVAAIFMQLDQRTSARLGDVLRGLKEKSAEWTELVSKVLKWGIENGEFAPFDVARMAKVFIGMIIGLIVQLEMGQVNEDLVNYRATLFGLVLKGITIK